MIVEDGATVKVGYTGGVSRACYLNLDDDNGTATFKAYEGSTLKFAAHNLDPIKHSWISADHIELVDVDTTKTITFTLDWIGGQPSTYDVELLIAYGSYTDGSTKTLPSGAQHGFWRGADAPYRLAFTDEQA